MLFKDNFTNMKNLIIFVLLSLNLVAQKSPKDVIDFNNFDYKFAEKLLFQRIQEEVNIWRKDTLLTYSYDSICYLAAEYQATNCINLGKLTHKNTNRFRDTILHSVTNRLCYFRKNNEKVSCSEVLGQTVIFPFYFVKQDSNIQWYVLDTIYDEYGNKKEKFIKTIRKKDNRQYYQYNSKNNSYIYTEKKDFFYYNGKIFDYSNGFTYELLINYFVEQYKISPAHWSVIECQEGYLTINKSAWKIVLKENPKTKEILIYNAGVFSK